MTNTVEEKIAALVGGPTSNLSPDRRNYIAGVFAAADIYRPALAAAQAEITRLRQAYAKDNDEICQELGKALGYPWYKNDQKNFSDATEADGVCVGEHVAGSLASEAAQKLTAAQAWIEELEDDVLAIRSRIRCVEKINETLSDWVDEAKAQIATLTADLAVARGKALEEIENWCNDQRRTMSGDNYASGEEYGLRRVEIYCGQLRALASAPVSTGVEDPAVAQGNA